MISLAGYKVLHVLGMLLVFTALGAMLAAGTRRTGGMAHGLGLVLLLVTGFGALANLGLSNPGVWPLWMWLKLLLWLVLGGIVVLIRRAPQLASTLWVLLPLLGAAAAYLALYKPGA